MGTKCTARLTGFSGEEIRTELITMRNELLPVYSFVRRAVLLAGILLLASGCSNRSLKETPDVLEDRPGALTVGVYPLDLEVEPESERMTVRWRRAGDGLISGYNIYIGQEPATRDSLGLNATDTLTPFNIGPYPGDTDPDDEVESFQAENLINGVKYYVTVRVIYPDGSLSPASNEVVAVCGPRGEITLDQRYRGSHDGFSFDKNTYVEADASANDLYYYSANGTDYLASPRRLGGYLRQSRFAHLSLTGTLQDIRPRLAKTKSEPSEDKIEIKPGDWIHIRSEDDRNAVMRVLGFEGDGRSRKVRLYLAYCPVAGEMLF